MSLDRLWGAEQLDLFGLLGPGDENAGTVPPTPAAVPPLPFPAAETPTTEMPADQAPTVESLADEGATLPAATTSDVVPPSRLGEPFRLPAGPPPTLAKVMHTVAEVPGLSDETRRDLRSAIRGIARILHQPPANLVVDIAQLNRDIYRHAPAAHGLGHEAFEQMVSRFRRSLRLVGWHAPDIKGEARLSATWKAFLGRVRPEGLRAGLRGLARFCDQRGLAPRDVDDALLARFVAEDAATRIFPGAHERGPELAHSWNRAVAQQPNQEGLAVVRAPRRRVAYTLPLEALPESFQADVAAFVERFTVMASKPRRGSNGQHGAGPWTRGPLLSPGGSRRRLRPWRPATRDSRVFSIRQAAAALIIIGMRPEEITSLAVLVQPIENAMRILQFYLDRADGKIGSQRESISKVLTLIARYHAPVPPEDLETIVDWHHEMTPRNQMEMGPKARECLRRIWQEERRAILLGLPAHLMECARNDELSPIERARLQRAACIVELFICCPMRISNMHKLTLAGHLRYLEGPRRPTHIQLEGRETKNHDDHDFGIPRSAGEMIQTYINQGRQLLAEPGNPYLFPGHGGAGPLSIDQMRAIFQDIVEGATGVRVHPHAMRGLACLVFLTRFPGQYEILRRLLGHKDVETTRRYYTGLETVVDFQMADEALLSQRRDSRLQGEAALARLRVTPHRKRGR